MVGEFLLFERMLFLDSLEIVLQTLRAVQGVIPFLLGCLLLLLDFVQLLLLVLDLVRQPLSQAIKDCLALLLMRSHCGQILHFFGLLLNTGFRGVQCDFKFLDLGVSLSNVFLKLCSFVILSLF